MTKNSNIKAIFFDFGGCIDGNGIHTRTRFLTGFTQNKSIEGIARERFQDAYTFADEKILKEKLCVHMNLYEMNLVMTKLICEDLKLEISYDKISTISQSISNAQSESIKTSTTTIEKLARNYTLGIISNFSGNLEIILEEFNIKQYFTHIFDSFHVGYLKPDIRLFNIATDSWISKNDGSHSEMYFIGDNSDRDVAPAKSLGMHTILIHEPGKKKDCAADFYIERFEELENIFVQ